MNKRWIHLCVIVVLSLLYFRGVLLSPREMVYSPDSDLVRYHAPQYSFFKESLLRDGEIPLWLPWRWSGTPFLADSQSAVFYPFTWLLLLVPPIHSFGFYFIIHAVLAGVFIYLYLAEIGLSRPATLIGSLLYMFSGASISVYFYHHVGYLLGWSALLLFLSERIVSRPRVFYAVVMGLVAAIQFLGSHAQYFTFSTCLVLCYIVWIVFLRPSAGTTGSRPKIAGCLLLSAAVFLALIAVQVLPSLELSRQFSRRGGFSFYESSYSLFYPWHLWRCVFTPTGKGLYSIYFGFGVSLLALWGAVLSGRRVKIFFIVFAILSLIYALGKFSPLFYLCYKLFPPFRYFREPERSLQVFSCCWIILASLGLDSLLNGGGAPRDARAPYRRSMRLAIGAVLLSAPLFFLNTERGHEFALSGARALYGLARFSSPFDAHRSEIDELLTQGAWMSLQLLLFIAAAFLLLGLVLRRSPQFRRRVVFPILACGVIGELFFVGRGLRTIRPEELYAESEPVRFIGSQSGIFRVLGMGSPRPLPQFIAQRYGIELTDGYSPSLLADYLVFTCGGTLAEEKRSATKLPLSDGTIDEIAHHEILDLLNVRYIVSLTPARNGRYQLRRAFHDVPVYRQFGGIVSEPDYYIYENDTALPRAFVVPEAKVVPDRGELLRLLGAVDLRRVVLLEKEAGEAAGDEPFRSVAYTTYRPNEIGLSVSLKHPAYLVLSEIWYPGWKAYDNGREREVLRADYLLRGLHLEAGDHDLVFRLEPTSYPKGKLISALGIAFVIAALFFSHRFARSARKSIPVAKGKRQENT